MTIAKQKKSIAEIKIHSMHLTAVNKNDKIVSDLDDRLRKIVQSEQYREKRLEKISRASLTCEIPNSLTYM